MKVLIAVLAVLLLLLQYALWFGRGNVFEVLRLREAIEAQQKKNAALAERNRLLEAEVIDLKRGVEAVEERARTELGMVRRGETFFQVIEEERRAGNK